MYSVRLWVVRHARAFERIYNMFEPVLVKLDPIFKKLGHDRIEKPMSAFESACKGLLFDCQMCGQCALSSTGMSCSMNCPKNLRNGPCGGVRLNGNCEVYEDRRCVWVEAWKGNQQMKNSDRIHVVQKPVDHSLKGSSSWLRVVRQISKQKSGDNSQ